MNRKRNLVIVLITFFLGVVIGELNLFSVSPNQDFGKPIQTLEKLPLNKKSSKKKSKHHCSYKIYLQPYSSKGVPMYSDRGYCNQKYNSDFTDLFVLQIPRHFRQPITFTALKPLVVYRGITDSDNSSDFDAWEVTALPFEVNGSCKFDKLVFKEFPKGDIKLSYGWDSASPILLKYLDGSPIKKLIVNGKQIKNNLGLKKTL